MMEFWNDKEKAAVLIQLSYLSVEWYAGAFYWFSSSFYQRCKRIGICLLRHDCKSSLGGKSDFQLFCRDICYGNRKKEEYFM